MFSFAIVQSENMGGLLRISGSYFQVLWNYRFWLFLVAPRRFSSSSSLSCCCDACLIVLLLLNRCCFDPCVRVKVSFAEYALLFSSSSKCDSKHGTGRWRGADVRSFWAFSVWEIHTHAYYINIEHIFIMMHCSCTQQPFKCEYDIVILFPCKYSIEFCGIQNRFAFITTHQ